MSVLRWTELSLLFFLTPLLVFLLISDQETWLMPMLFVTGAACLVVLLRDNNFKRFRLWLPASYSVHLRAVLKLFIPCALLLAVCAYLVTPDIFFILPREELPFWLLTLAIYPIVSVIPQELIFRTFFFHRYKGIIPSKTFRWLLSTLCFAFAHIVYGNWIAVGLSLCGGLLFGYRYMQTRSTMLVVIEHSLWGCYLFTLGLGVFLLAQNS